MLPERRSGASSDSIRERVERARELQSRRLAAISALTNDPAETLLGTDVRRMAISPSVHHRVIKLADPAHIGAAHIADALQYRTRVAEGQ